MKHPIVVAITGASGVIYATRLLEVLLHIGHDVQLTISPAGKIVLEQELDLKVDLENFSKSTLLLGEDKNADDSKLDMMRTLAGISSEESNVLSESTGRPGTLTYHHYRDFFAPMASGSALSAGMVICPCSGSTLAGIATGAGDNLVHRAAHVHLKEKRPLILVPRETPLSLPQLENMRRACEFGAVVMPAMPGWYHGVKSLRDLVDFMVARILDQLHIEHSLIKRWGE